MELILSRTLSLNGFKMLLPCISKYTETAYAASPRRVVTLRSMHFVKYIFTELETAENYVLVGS